LSLALLVRGEGLVWFDEGWKKTIFSHFNGERAVCGQASEMVAA